jgi:SulP family sulfate permease
MLSLARRYLPILSWGAEYTSRTLTNDLIVAGIVTIMLIPQSLAYAMLAGLPAQVGLYASMAPLVLYAIFGTSRALAVGPVAVISLMTAAAVSPLAAQGTPEYLGAAIAMALVSGLLLLAMGLLRPANWRPCSASGWRVRPSWNWPSRSVTTSGRPIS